MLKCSLPIWIELFFICFRKRTHSVGSRLSGCNHSETSVTSEIVLPHFWHNTATHDKCPLWQLPLLSNSIANSITILLRKYFRSKKIIFETWPKIINILVTVNEYIKGPNPWNSWLVYCTLVDLTDIRTDEQTFLRKLFMSFQH